MIGMSETPYDLRFRVLGIPVRVHPFFWLVAAMLGWRPHNIPMVVLWVGCVFVSILVHEYGHGLMAKAYDCSPSIVLQGLFGLCYSNSERLTPRQRLAVIFGGPGAGFVLCVLVMLVASAIFGITASEHTGMIADLLGLGSRPASIDFKLRAELNFEIYKNLVWINLVWGLINLLPIWPLDGGQACQILLSLYDRARGVRWGHIVSLLVAGSLAVLAFTWTSDIFLTIFFALFAVINFQILQSLHQAHALGAYQDDEWWRR
jgi:membrane-associated protease RseP (regulator of RpoE activity)